eukprot:XP_022277435.1 uncharacterized protein LOC111096935 [Canis lupus familiaris]
MSVKLFELLEDVNKYQSRNLFNRRTRAAGAWGVRGNFRSTRARDPQTLSGRSVGATTSIWRRSSRFSPGESAHGNPASVAADGPSPHADRAACPSEVASAAGAASGPDPTRARLHRARGSRRPSCPRSFRTNAAAPPLLCGASWGLRWPPHLRLSRGTSTVTPSLPGLSSLAQFDHPPNSLPTRQRGLGPSLDKTEDQAPATQRGGWGPPLAAGADETLRAKKRLSAGPPQAPPTDLITLPAHPQPVLQLPRSHLEDSNALLTAGSPASPSELNVSEDCALPPRGAHRVAATGLRSALHPHPFP